MPSAEGQITEQVLYIAVDSVDNALAWERRLRDRINKLADLPGYAVDEDATRRLGYVVQRYVFESNYLVHFTVELNRRLITIVNFRHVARRPRPGEP